MAEFEEQAAIMDVREAVEKYFEADEIKHEPFDGNNVAHAGFAVKSRFGHVDVFFHAFKDKLLIRAYLPLKAGEQERAKVGEFLMRANYGLKFGGFDYDYDDGEISYRTSIYCGSDEFEPPTYEQIDFALMVGILTVDRYGDALAKVIFGLVEPVDAIESVEDTD